MKNPIKTFIEKRAAKIANIKIEKFVDDNVASTVFSTESNYAPETKEDYTIAFERSVWAYACVHSIASNIASLPIKLYTKGTDTEVTTGPMYDLVNYPNDEQGLFDFLEELVGYMELTGDGFIELNDAKNPTGMKPIRSYWMEIVQLKDGTYQYNFKPNGVKQSTLDDEHCIHIKYFNPRSSLYGFAGVQSATNSLIQDFYVTSYSKKFYEKGGMINTYLSVKKILQDFEFKRLKQETKSNLQGISNAHNVPVFDGDSELKSVNSGAEAILLKANRDQYRDEILTAFGVPPIMLAVLAGQETYNNADTQKRIFWEATIIPKLRKIQDILNRRLFIKFGVECKFDTSGVAALKEDESKKATTAKTLVDGGIISANEARAIYYDMDPIEGGDALKSAAANPFGEFAKMINKMAFITNEKKNSIRKNKFIKAVNVHLLKEAITTNEKVFNNRVSKLEDALKPLMDKMADAVLSKLPKTAIKKDEGGVQICTGGGVQICTGVNGKNGEIKSETPNIDKKETLKKADYSKTIASALDDETADMMKQLIEHNKETMRESATASIKRSGRTIRDLDQRIVSIIDANEEHITKWAEESADSIVETYKSRVTNFLDTASVNNMEIADVRKGIQEIFVGTERDSYPRAQMIARTETNRMVSQGTVEAAKDMGFKKKMWVSTLDNKCRDSHRAANGQTVDIDEPFDVGEAQLNYPGDSSLGAGPEEICNCRCGLVERD